MQLRGCNCRRFFSILDQCNDPSVPYNAVYAGTRQILNLQEILDQCNDPKKANWAQALNGTRWRSVECRTFSFGKDLFEGMAVAQQVWKISDPDL